MTTERTAELIEEIIAEKEKKGVGPYQCDMLELHQRTGESPKTLTNLMRQLIRDGQYRGSITINKIPILRRKE